MTFYPQTIIPYTFSFLGSEFSLMVGTEKLFPLLFRLQFLHTDGGKISPAGWVRPCSHKNIAGKRKHLPKPCIPSPVAVVNNQQHLCAAGKLRDHIHFFGKIPRLAFIFFRCKPEIFYRKLEIIADQFLKSYIIRQKKHGIILFCMLSDVLSCQSCFSDSSDAV